MIVPLPNGGSVDTGNNPNFVSFEGVTLHTPLALLRLIEFWKNKPNLRGVLANYTDEIQLLENAVWDTINKRLLDNATFAQLDVLGAIVGEPRDGLADDPYRVRIRVRILINKSFGTVPDVIGVLKLADTAAFHYVRYGTAAFQIYYDAPPSSAAAGQLARFLRETRAAGVRCSVVVPTSLTRGARWGSIYDGSLNASIGWSSHYDGTVGGLWGHQALA